MSFEHVKSSPTHSQPAKEKQYRLYMLPQPHFYEHPLTWIYRVIIDNHFPIEFFMTEVVHENFHHDQDNHDFYHELMAVMLKVQQMSSLSHEKLRPLFDYCKNFQLALKLYRATGYNLQISHTFKICPECVQEEHGLPIIHWHWTLPHLDVCPVHVGNLLLTSCPTCSTAISFKRTLDRIPTDFRRDDFMSCSYCHTPWSAMPSSKINKQTWHILRKLYEFQYFGLNTHFRYHPRDLEPCSILPSHRNDTDGI